ncbi:MAG: penicillin acylase family protein [Candidatus Eremiobacteraeota bacterium]|nr:penicillin acylase family protein [Candidatus Eremiobacteraeota bacterium]
MRRAAAVTAAAVLAGACVRGDAAPAAKHGATIAWDTWGVPHVRAADPRAMMRAFGYAQARLHGNLLLRLYDEARGRAAEDFGADELPFDETTVTFDFPGLGKRAYAAQDPAFRAMVDAFADGIDAYGAAHPDALSADARRVLPVRGTDVMAHVARILFFFLTSNACTPAIAADLPRFAHAGDPPAGSNGWALAPSRTTDHHAMLMANPHLIWGDMFTWVEAQLAAPGYDVSGAALVGWPVLAIGFDDAHGWTHTVNTSDGCDAYTLVPDGDGYRFDGAHRAFATRTVTLRARRPDGRFDTVPYTVRRAAQGPVVTLGSTMLAIRVVGIDGSRDDGALREWCDLSRAHDLGTFRAALARLQIPMFNTIYADRAGHVMLNFNGQVPVHASGDFAAWAHPVSGDTSANVWNTIEPERALPTVIDPPSGWLQNANSPPWSATFPLALDPANFPADLAPKPWIRYRELSGIRLLRDPRPFDLDRLVAAKFSNRAELADRVLDDLVAAARASDDAQTRAAGDVLAAWDRTTAAESKGAALFYAWVREMKITGATDQDVLAVPFDPANPDGSAHGLKDHAAAVAALGRAATRAVSECGALDAAWGACFRLRRGTTDLPASTGPETMGIVAATVFRPAADKKFASYGGDTFMFAADFGPTTVHARVLLPYGNASQPGSPHVADQLSLYARAAMRDAWRTPREVDAHLESRETLDR